MFPFEVFDDAHNAAFASGYTVLRRFRHGNAGVFLCLLKDSYIGGALELFGEYSEAEVDVFRRFVRHDDIVIDAGALFGVHTIALAELCPRGTVLAFEPQRIPLQILCANLQLNSIANVDASKSALGADEGVAMVPGFDPRHDNPWGLTTLATPAMHDDKLRGELVRVRSVDSLHLARLDFMKIDVEGFEPFVLEGARLTIARCRPVLYLEYNTNRLRLVSLLGELGYRLIYRHYAPVDRWPNFSRRTINARETPTPSDMVLAIPDERAGPDDPQWLFKNGFHLKLEMGFQG